MNEWEMVHKGEYDFTDRLEVPGGWLYRNQVLCNYQDSLTNYVPTLAFVPLREYRP